MHRKLQASSEVDIPTWNFFNLLKNVDLSNAHIEEIQEFTFVHCTSLKEVRLRRHSIRLELKPL